MSDNINQMNIKQLRNEVQLLRDELAIMKRKYKDIIYNLDTDNFSSRFTREQKNMKSAIEFTAEGIKTKVSKEELDNSLSEYSTIVQTASMINTTVTKEYVIDKLGDDYVTNAVLSSEIKQTADEIYLSVSGNYETKSDANANYNALHSSISSVSVTANGIETRVEDLESFKTSVFTQKSEGFYLDGDVTKFTGVLYLTDDSFNDKASIYYGDGSDDMNQEYIAFWPNNYSMPMVFGYNPEKVYISSIADGNQIATRQWVLDNAGIDGTIVAVFG